jgi:hypothetical protein
MTTLTVPAATAAALLNPEVPVRGLTVRQPFTSAICYLDKLIENRAHRTRYTGLVLIHSAKLANEDALREVPRDTPQLDQRRAVLGVARITGCHTTLACGGRCSVWAQPDRVHWQLADVLPLHRPVYDCSSTRPGTTAGSAGASEFSGEGTAGRLI